MRIAIRFLPGFAGMLVIAASGSSPCGETAEDSGAGRKPIRDTLGVTHVAGKYHLTKKGYLQEGAEQILELGSRVIKLYLFKPASNYPYNTEWPTCSSLVDIARTPPFRQVFKKPFTTFVLTAYSPARPEHYWRKGVSEEEAADETREFEELTRHLLHTYAGTGKTFILQHWEGDWALRGSFDPRAPLDSTAVQGMIDWLNARQKGVDAARRKVAPGADPRVRVYHATEVNLVVQALRKDLPGVVDRVLPHSQVDLVSYSAWDAQKDPGTLRAALDFIARHLPEKKLPLRRRVYIGEFGAPENDFSPEAVTSTIQGTIRTGLDWGCPWIIYWQVYCNEPRRTPVRSNDDVRGFHLVRPDGQHARSWDLLEELLED